MGVFLLSVFSKKKKMKYTRAHLDYVPCCSFGQLTSPVPPSTSTRSNWHSSRSTWFVGWSTSILKAWSSLPRRKVRHFPLFAILLLCNPTRLANHRFPTCDVDSRHGMFTRDSFVSSGRERKKKRRKKEKKRKARRRVVDRCQPPRSFFIPRAAYI